MSTMKQLAQHGQAVWFDYIRRSFIASGELQALVDAGVRGVTSNPAIFEQAIAGSADYDADLRTLVHAGHTVEEIYEALALEDIRLACAVLHPVYAASNGEDGYVSIEVSPTLADNTAATIAEARRLFSTLALPNVMIKVPATPAGVPAVEELIAAGINVNVTLIFSRAQYEAVARAYLTGLQTRHRAGGELGHVASVASFFVSRVDTAVDPLLTDLGATDLAGKIANDNAKVAYARFQQLFSGDVWQQLAAAGARVQRPLWASTGTKNPAYSDTLYVDELIGPHTVNTVPPATLEAFRHHGKVASTLTTDLDGCHTRLARLAELGINLDAITQQLQDDGVAAFAQAFEGLMASISDRRARLLGGATS